MSRRGSPSGAEARRSQASVFVTGGFCSSARVAPAARRPRAGDGGLGLLHFRPVSREIDYALARRLTVREFRSGALTRVDVCDAHPELLRAARNLGEDSDEDCPVCSTPGAAARALRVRRHAQGRERSLRRGREGARAAAGLGRRVRVLRRRGLRRLRVELPHPLHDPRPRSGGDRRVPEAPWGCTCTCGSVTLTRAAGSRMALDGEGGDMSAIGSHVPVTRRGSGTRRVRGHRS